MTFQSLTLSSRVEYYLVDFYERGFHRNALYSILVYILLVWGTSLARAAEAYSVFGNDSQVGLIGIIYDLKQTQKREPSGVGANNYVDVVRAFVKGNWDEAVLSRFFRTARPLYTTQIFVPLMGAQEAPKAFGLAGIIKPSAWLVHYKGQVAPPASGSYRFICYADDLIAIAVNGKMVCDGSRRDSWLEAWTPEEEKKGPKAANGDLTYGDWMNLSTDEPIDLDIIIGERPGGEFCAFLLYERKGETYPLDGGTTMYPIFQLAPHINATSPVDRAPRFSTPTSPWKSYQ